MAPYFRLRLAALARSPALNLVRFRDRGVKGFGCPAGRSKLGVTADGRVTGCAFLGSAGLGGSVREHPLAELWERQAVWGANLAVNATCRACPALPATGGGCRARALFLLGDLNAPDPYCCALNRQRESAERGWELTATELSEEAAPWR